MFSKSTEYAMRACIFIAQNASQSHRLTIQEIATGINAPKPFTAKILQKLSHKDNPLIHSSPGPAGGFYFTEEGLLINVYDIIQVMGERNVIESCVLGFETCSDTNPCAMHHEYKSVKQRLLQIFKTKTIKELSSPNNPLIYNFSINN